VQYHTVNSDSRAGENKGKREVGQVEITDYFAGKIEEGYYRDVKWIQLLMFVTFCPVLPSVVFLNSQRGYTCCIQLLDRTYSNETKVERGDLDDCDPPS
jgi:hypothetical protein